jgi:AcrR family transcriptional regulator
VRITEEAKSATRQRILKAAQGLFARRGFEATTTREIAREAGIATGTLFNYFPTKEAVAHCLVSEAGSLAATNFAVESSGSDSAALSLEEELFAHVAAVLRKLRPYRKYVSAVLDGAFSPLAARPDADEHSFQSAHLETVGQIAARHGAGELFAGVALHLYWTLYVGLLSFWSRDSSPRQEDTLALLDESLAMFVGWLGTPSRGTAADAKPETPNSDGE